MAKHRMPSRRDAAQDLLTAVVALERFSRIGTDLPSVPRPPYSMHVLEAPSDTHNMTVNGFAVAAFVTNPAITPIIFAIGGGVWALSQLGFVPENLRRRTATEIDRNAGQMLAKAIMRHEANTDEILPLLTGNVEAAYIRARCLFDRQSLPELIEQSCATLRQGPPEMPVAALGA